MRRTQESRRSDTRARLLEAAAARFAEQGVDAVSVDALAAAAGRTSGAVYAHFGSKQGLLMALLDGWAHTLAGLVGAELETATTMQQRLRAVASNVVVRPSAETRRLFMLERELALRAQRDPSLAGAMRRRWQEANERLSRGFASWVAQGLLPEDTDPGTLAVAFRAAVLGLELQQRIDPVLDEATAADALAGVLGLSRASAST